MRSLTKGKSSLVAVVSLAFVITSSQLAAPAHAEGLPTPPPPTATASASSDAGASHDAAAIARVAHGYRAGDAATAADLAEVASATDAIALTETRSGLKAEGENGTDVTVSTGDGVIVSAAGAPDIGISVAGEADSAKLVDGALVETGIAPSIDVVTRATEDGAQVVAILADERAPEALGFELAVPKSATLEKKRDGSLSVMAPMTMEIPDQSAARRYQSEVEAVLADGRGGGVSDEQRARLARIKLPSTHKVTRVRELARLAAPWAVDAGGKHLSTHYEVVGTTVRQIVDRDSSTVYPVTVDPRVRVAWYGWSVDFSRSDTLFLGAGAVGCDKVTAKSPPGVGRAIQLYCAFLTGWAALAIAQGKCISAKLFNPYMWAPWISKCYA